MALLTTIPAAAYKLTVRNLSKRQVEMRIKYKRNKCRVAPSYMGFMPGEKKVLKHGVCCLSTLTLTPRTGPGKKGPFGPFDPPKLTGRGFSCTSNNVRIVDLPNGELSLENDEKRDSGYAVVVQNGTKYPLQVRIDSANEGVCPYDYARVKPLGLLRHYTGHGSGVVIARCCPKKIWVRATAGPDRAQKWYTFNPKRTGPGQSCRDNRIIVQAKPDGSLRIKGV